ncbi:MAG: RNA polymerase sigma factor [Rikenellaceae bacterium]
MIREKEMIQRALKGDKEAFNTIIEAQHDSVMQYVSSLCNGQIDSADILQETYIKAYLKLEKYNPDYPLNVWLKRIARNTFIDFVRKEDAADISILSEIDLLNEKESTPEELIINLERMKYVEKELSMLPVNYQQIIELRYFQSLSYVEIAERLSIPMGTVKTQLFRAKKMLLGIADALK